MPASSEDALELDRLLDLEVVELDVLPRGDVREPAAPALGHLGEGVELVGGDEPAGDLDPLHVLDVGELHVDAHRQAERAKLIRRDLTGLEFGDVLGVLVDRRCEPLGTMSHGTRIVVKPAHASSSDGRFGSLSERRSLPQQQRGSPSR